MRLQDIIDEKEDAEMDILLYAPRLKSWADVKRASDADIIAEIGRYRHTSYRETNQDTQRNDNVSSNQESAGNSLSPSLLTSWLSL